MKSLYEKPYDSPKLPVVAVQPPVARPIVIAPAPAPIPASPVPPAAPTASTPPVPPVPPVPPAPAIDPQSSTTESTPADPSPPPAPSAPVKHTFKPGPTKPVMPAFPPSKSVSRPTAIPVRPITAAVPVAPPAAPTAGRQPSDPTQGASRVLLVSRIMAVAITLAMLGLIGRIAQLQVSPPPQIAALLGTQNSKNTLMARRGTITDREGRILATTGLAHRLVVDPRKITEPGTFPELLSHALDYDAAAIARRLHLLANKRYVVIDQKLTDEQWLKLETIRSRAARQLAPGNTASADDIPWHRLAGLYTDLWLERQYPQGAVGGHVIGFVGQEGTGFEGAERIFNGSLTGTPGELGYLRDAGQRPMDLNINEYQPPADGRPVRLSIDITIQAIAEAELARACREFNAKTGEMVIMDPHTGEILAMANYPAFDPNEVRTTRPAIRRNRSVTDPFEPGSTFKPFIWAFAVEQGFARPEQMINTDQYVGRPLRDTHHHGTISWAQVLIKSSNRGMAMIGQKMGNTKLHHAVKSFGFGELTHTGFPGESRGQVNPLHRWNPRFSPTSVPMGQEVAVTPLQLTRAFCVFANGGYLVTPTIEAKDPHDDRSLTVTQRVLSPRTVDITKHVMRQVVTEGTGRKANSPHYAIFGKTGTAQIARSDGRGYDPGAYTGAFVAGAPLDKPRIVVACAIHRPTGGDYYGGTVAAPAVMHAINQTLNYMGVAPMTTNLVDAGTGR